MNIIKKQIKIIPSELWITYMGYSLLMISLFCLWKDFALLYIYPPRLKLNYNRSMYSSVRLIREGEECPEMYDSLLSNQISSSLSSAYCKCDGRLYSQYQCKYLQLGIHCMQISYLDNYTQENLSSFAFINSHTKLFQKWQLCGKVFQGKPLQNVKESCGNDYHLCEIYNGKKLCAKTVGECEEYFKFDSDSQQKECQYQSMNVLAYRDEICLSQHNMEESSRYCLNSQKQCSYQNNTIFCIHKQENCPISDILILNELEHIPIGYQEQPIAFTSTYRLFILTSNINLTPIIDFYISTQLYQADQYNQQEINLEQILFKNEKYDYENYIESQFIEFSPHPISSDQLFNQEGKNHEKQQQQQQQQKQQQQYKLYYQKQIDNTQECAEEIIEKFSSELYSIQSILFKSCISLTILTVSTYILLFVEIPTDSYKKLLFKSVGLMYLVTLCCICLLHYYIKYSITTQSFLFQTQCSLQFLIHEQFRLFNLRYQSIATIPYKVIAFYFYIFELIFL